MSTQLQIPQELLSYIEQFSFRGNTNIRPAGSQVEYTQEMLDELVKCSNDPIYFIKKYIKVIHVDRGMVPLELYPYQEKMIDSYHKNRRVLSLLFRQAGKTTTTAAFITWYILFNDDKTCLILANKAALAREILHRIRTAYEGLPKWMQQGVVSWNKGSIELENGSRAIASATSGNAGRGYSVSLLYCVAGETEITIQHRLSKDTKTVQICTLATSEYTENTDWDILTKDGFKPFSGIRVTNNVQLYKVTTTTQTIRVSEDHQFLLSDTTWKCASELIENDTLDGGERVCKIEKDLIETVYDPVNVEGTKSYLVGSITNHNCDEFAHVEPNVAEDFFTSVYPTISSGKDTKILISSTPNGFNMFHKFWVDAEKGTNGFIPQRFDWWEHPERDQKWADEQLAVLGELKYNQEVLMTFNGSSKSLLSGQTLARLAYINPIKEFDGQEKGLKIYRWPEKHRKYVMTVDVSRGRHLDYSTFTVFDITEYPHRIAATYRNNEISPMLYASMIHNVAMKYNEAYTLIEINDVGAQVADILWHELEYEAMFWTKGGDELGKTGSDPYPGIRTTKKTKRIGCSNAKDIIDNQQLIVDDYEMIHEFSTFVQTDSGSYEADPGANAHDDVVMTVVLYAWMATQSWFRDLTDSDLRIKMHEDHVRQMEDTLAMPMFNDGTEMYDGHESSVQEAMDASFMY